MTGAVVCGVAWAELVELALSMGATRAEERWVQRHYWTALRDTSGNEFCVLRDL